MADELMADVEEANRRMVEEKEAEEEDEAG